METNRQLPGYQKLLVWKEAHILVLFVYKITQQWPKNELFGLTSQIRRAAVSIPANIVEGYAKKSRKDFSRFLDISIGSATELGLFLEISLELNYFSKSIFEKTNNLLTEVKKLLYSFQKSLRVTEV